MSMIYCAYCHKYVDTDWQDQHFDEDGENCMKQLEDQPKN